MLIRREYFEKYSTNARTAKGTRTTLKMPEKLCRRATEMKIIPKWVSLFSWDHSKFSSNRGFKVCYCSISVGLSWYRICTFCVQARDCRINGGKYSLYVSNLSETVTVCTVWAKLTFSWLNYLYQNLQKRKNSYNLSRNFPNHWLGQIKCCKIKGTKSDSKLNSCM